MVFYIVTHYSRSLLILICITLGSSNLVVTPPLACEPDGYSCPELASNGDIYYAFIMF